MKRLLLAVTAALGVQAAFAAPPDDAGELLTGDTRLACEAILCLSSGERPHECDPALRKYFSIHRSKPWKTINARRDFLNLCPASKEKNMPGLINAIANGAGRCDAKELNRVNSYRKLVQVCKESPFKYRGRAQQNCEWRYKTFVRNQYPSYCKAYFEHDWTRAADSVKYVGDEKNGGRWVDAQ